MKLRPITNNTAVRFFNGNDRQGDAASTGSGPMIVQIEEGDEVSFSLPPGKTMKLVGQNALGEQQWGVSDRNLAERSSLGEWARHDTLI